MGLLSLFPENALLLNACLTHLTLKLVGLKFKQFPWSGLHLEPFFQETPPSGKDASPHFSHEQLSSSKAKH